MSSRPSFPLDTITTCTGSPPTAIRLLLQAELYITLKEQKEQLCNIQFSSQSRGALSRVLSSCVLSSGRADAYQEQRKRRDEDHLRREAVLHQAEGLAASRDNPQPWFTSPLFGVLAQTALTWKHQSELNSDLLITGSDLI